MNIITMAAIKGGTGKTATAAALAQAAKQAGQRVLAIDLDPQANLTQSLKAEQRQAGIYSVLHGRDAKEVIQHTEQGIDVISASPDLSTELSKPGSALRLRKAIQPIKDSYDTCIIDTPPTLGELVYNAMQAANVLIIPVETDSSSLQGFYQTVDVARQMQSTNKELSLISTVITRYDGRPTLNKYLHEVITDKAKATGADVLGTIRAGVAVREAAAMQVNLFEYKPKSKPALDYKKLFEAIERQLIENLQETFY